jgi:MauM/NapG family ferredoxin protein
MKLVLARRIAQAAFLLLFLLVLAAADSRWLGGGPLGIALSLDPLLAVVTALAAKTFYAGMLLSLFVLLPAIFLGRVFCGWVCPLGTLNQFMTRLFASHDRRTQAERNRHRPAMYVKYYVLAAALVLAACGVGQAGLLDPLALLTRSLSASIFPAAGVITGGLVLPERLFVAGWALGAGLVAVLLLNAVIPRFYCRVVCPLGAMLGLVSRLRVVHVNRSQSLCIQCDRCQAVCPAAADPHLRLRRAECYGCMNCRAACPVQAISVRALPPEHESVVAPDLNRRRLLATGVVALLSAPLLKASVRGATLPPPGLIRPPGATPEGEFLARCVKCGACMKVCPTNVIQPALLEGGIEGVWTPVMVNRVGYCEPECVQCGVACPTGAIRKFSREEKLGRPPFSAPIRIGTAFVDRGRCLPWAMNKPCSVCEEVCPVSPKAIRLESAESVDSAGDRVVMLRPVVDPVRCTGCGLCEHRCPVFDRRAIRVSSVGESRSERNTLFPRESPPAVRRPEGEARA